MKKLCVSKKILVVGIIAVVFSLCICAIGGCSGGSGQGDGQIEVIFREVGNCQACQRADKHTRKKI